MRRVAASAPAKIILFGEHFVVKGAKAIAAAVDLRARAIASEYKGRGVIVESKDLGFKYRIDPDNLRSTHPRYVAPIARILLWLKNRGYDIMPARVVIESPIPVGSGLGSSAASSAAFTLAYTAFHGSPVHGEDLIAATIEAEVEAHGRPSGIDPTITVYGGIVSFRRGERPVMIESRLDPIEYPIVIADSGIKRSTREAVEAVLNLASRRWTILDYIYRAADQISREAVDALGRGDPYTLGELMNINHGLLSAIGVSLGELEDLVYTARIEGALGSKITGAGRGGSVIALTHFKASERIVLSLASKARWVSRVKVGVPGARLES